MAKYSFQKTNSLNVISYILLLSYLCIGFIPNLKAVDKIAPQWLVMSLFNIISLIFFYKNRISLSIPITRIIKAKLSVIYIFFILWALGSIFYAINSTEVLVNISRQINVLVMYLSMSICLYNIKDNFKFISWIITIIIGIEIYAVLNEAIEMINEKGMLVSGILKGVTANRNITAFSIAIKLPFLLYLIYLTKKKWIKFIVSLIITSGLICLSMIQSRASFIAIFGLAIAFVILNVMIYLKHNRKINQLFKIGFLIIPLIVAILINKIFISDKGADFISRASTISLSTKDGSVNQRLRYYSDVLEHVISNPLFGVGLGNWKLKSIEYDKNEIIGYVVPYHAHSDFIQLGAELGIIGFLLYLGIFILAIYYVILLIKEQEINTNKKILLFLLLSALGIYSVDANLNFPIARPQVLVIWTLIMGIITSQYQKFKFQNSSVKNSKIINNNFIFMATLLVLPSIFINNKVYKSLKGQMILLQDFNSNQYNLPLNQVDNIVPEMPNITVTTIPINSVKARYYVKAKKYDKALDLIDNGTKANPYLYYSEILKSQIFEEREELDSAKFYAKKAFFGLPNNDLHSSKYVNLINITRDKIALEEAFELLTRKNKLTNWKNYLVIASNLEPINNNKIIERAKKALKLFPNNGDIKRLYSKILIGEEALILSSKYSSKGLEYFNNQDYKNAAIQFENAANVNSLDYSFFENAATANYMIGNFDKALEQINKVINDLNPLNGKCEYIKALIFIKMGDPIGACPLLSTSKDSGFNKAESIYNQFCI
ncbi:MAG: O-antigen ligase family protein [Flavobacteriaceae bacterium]